MSHSNRLKLHWSLVAAEIVLAVIAVAAAYFGETQSWPLFFGVSVVSLLLYAVVRILHAAPKARELLVRENMAAHMADSAMVVGVTHFFNMQSTEALAPLGISQVNTSR